MIEDYLKLSTKGRTKKSPGPLAAPDWRRPSRKITALSYSFTIQKNVNINFFFEFQEITKRIYLEAEEDTDWESDKDQDIAQSNYKGSK